MERSQKSPQSMMKELADKFWEMVESSAAVRHVRNQAEKKRTPTIREFLSGWSLEELREMGGQPYWHVGLREESPPPHWNILDPFYAKHIEDYRYGENWLAYRRPPEGEEDWK